jgi:hypothetical protein
VQGQGGTVGTGGRHSVEGQGGTVGTGGRHSVQGQKKKHAVLMFGVSLVDASAMHDAGWPSCSLLLHAAGIVVRI